MASIILKLIYRMENIGTLSLAFHFLFSGFLHVFQILQVLKMAVYECLNGHDLSNLFVSARLAMQELPDYILILKATRLVLRGYH